jgi:Acyltransferase family
MQLDENRQLLHDYHWYEVLARWVFFPASYQLWFIRVLLVYNLAYPALQWCVTHRIARWIFFPSAIFLWLSTFGFVLVEGEGLLFFSLGIWMKKNSFDIDSPSRWLKPRYWWPVFIGLSVLKTIFAFQPPFQPVEPLLLVMHKAVVLSGLICAWYGSNALVKALMQKPWFVWTSAFSFMIYAIHAPLVAYVVKALMMVPPMWSGYRITLFVLVPVGLLVMAVCFGAVLRKFLPGVYAFVTGGRGMS